MSADRVYIVVCVKYMRKDSGKDSVVSLVVKSVHAN